MKIGFLGIGSNVGERRDNLQAAVGLLEQEGISVLGSSSVYETEPVGLVLDQSDFLNACLRIGTSAGPEELLASCKSVERELGRTPGGVRHGPRPIDVDVLLLDGLEYRSEKLTLPHPEVRSRRFVLVPLLELEPGLSLPDGTELRGALDALGPGQDVVRFGPPLDLSG